MRIPAKSSVIYWNAIRQIGLILERLGLDDRSEVAESVDEPVWGER
jgi:hypothetical protein